MRNGWTGGQFSVVRVALGLCFGAQGIVWLLTAAGDKAEIIVLLSLVWMVFAFAFVSGVFSRVTAVCLGVLSAGHWSQELIALFAHGIAVPKLDDLAARADAAYALQWIVLCAVIALLPRAPYGSWPARGRVDPGGGWRFRPWLFVTVWVFWVAFHGLAAFVEWRRGDAFVASHAWLFGLRVAFVLAALSSKTRPIAWIVLVASMILGWRELAHGDDGGVATIALLALTFDPAWIRPRAGAAPIFVFYDGSCGLCHRVVRFALAEDRDGSRLRFAPLGGETFEKTIAARERERLPDSIVVVEGDELLLRSRAAARMLATLGGFWRVAAWAILVVPAPLADLVYDGIARLRKTVFLPPKSACPLLPAHLAQRFAP
ncbi:MAG: DCC1-like thiol-disulfide oxidoreductase family protein [Planctomycetes bacterium]|nr:DCC1-like thiol-disulfide oxidoreductase family protein [Planctomycetota bacterium]